MTRELKSGEEIREEVARILHDCDTVREDRATIGVPLPMSLQEPDGTGCNWTIMSLQNARGYANEGAAAILQVQVKWNLKD